MQAFRRNRTYLDAVFGIITMVRELPIWKSRRLIMHNSRIPIILACILPGLLTAMAGVTTAAEPAAPHRLRAIPIQQVAIEDGFWSPKRAVWRAVTIPDCFTKFENDRGGAINNFDRVRDGKVGGHAGPEWYDGLIYEMIRGTADFLAARRDAELERRLDGYIERIAAAQARDPDGYLNTWTQLMAPSKRWGLNGGNDVQQHDVYNCGAMVEAAVHYYLATGKTNLLRVAVKFANCACDVMGPPPKANVIPGHAGPEEAFSALYLLFRARPELKAEMPVPIDEDRYLKLAEFWIDNRGNHQGRTDYGSYDQDHKLVFRQETLEGHAVRATLMGTGLAALADINGQTEYYQSACRLWNNMISRRMHVNGGVGASRAGEAFAADYILPNNGYLETCAAIGSGFFSRNMNLLCGDARYVDELERSLYNASLAGVSLAGDTYFYEDPLEGAENRVRWSWHSCPCCPPMFLKIMGAMPGYVYAQDDRGIYVNLFVGSRAEVRLPSGPSAELKISLRQTTRYPWQGDVKFEVDPEKRAEFDLNIRIPGWCQGASSPDDLYQVIGRPARGAARLTVNGQTIKDPELVRGYARLHRRWKPGDVVQLAMDMPVRKIKAHPKVEADVGRVALMRGPLVYCLEGADNARGVRNLVVRPESQFSAEFRADLLGGSTVVTGSATAVYREASGELKEEAAELLAVPYFANCNRQPCEMAVWLAESADHAEPRPATAASIVVQADRTLHPVSRYLTGACIEDVNHEIYGGIYSQMVFGESFQEPPISPLKGFKVLGGAWRSQGEELLFSGTAGDKLVSELPAFADGEAGVEVFVPDRRSTNAGLIVRVADPKQGVDDFDGYEIAINAAAQVVRLGRHRHNWELIKDMPYAVPVGQWVRLAVKLQGPTIDVSVNGKHVVRYDDRDATLPAGKVGLRQFQPEARYRNLWIKTGSKMQSLPFASDAAHPCEVSGLWRPVQTGSATGAFRSETDRPFVGRQSQRLTYLAGQGQIGVENQGLNRWGMHFVEGKPYEGVLWARADAAVELIVALQNKDGSQTLAEERLAIQPGDWRRQSFTLTPKATATGRLAITLGKPGSVVLGYAFLQPGDWGRFHGLPVRRDVAEGLVDQGITVLRYGGSMVNHPEYRWKTMIGPRDRRPPYRGTWYPYSSNGWGILDFLDFCAAAGFLAIPDLNVNETPQDMSDFIEYVNGPVSSEWGKRRAADGHSAPYHLSYIELGNEERVDENYFQKFKPLAEAIWARDPRITIVVGDFAYGQAIRDPFHFRGADSGITSLAAQQQIMQLARGHDREVWFDIHVGTNGPRPDFAGTMSYVDALEKLANGTKHRVVIFEFNAGNHGQRRALANAIAINRVERDGRFPIATSANCLQPDGQNDNGWNQGLLFLDPSHVWLQPPGYVTQMISRNYQPRAVYCEVTGGKDALDASAARSDDGRTLVLRAVNPTNSTMSAEIRLAEFRLTKTSAQVTELSAPLEARNTALEPRIVVPHQRDWKHGVIDGRTHYAFPPYSVTVIRFE
jgi:DUF1680 family protein